MKRVLIGGLLFASAGLWAQTQEDVVFRAMRDELQRSLKKLQLEQLQRPYFISYRVVETNSKNVGAGFGSLLSSSETRGRHLTVNVRVGDYALDNSNFLSPRFGGMGVETQMFAGSVMLPLDDNYDELRRQLWLATDAAYKKALEDLAGKRAALENKHRTEEIPDFSKETPTKVEDLAPAMDVALREAERLARDLSAVFRRIPAAQTSHVQFTADNMLERFINSEGTTFTRRTGVAWVRTSASTQASDGTPLSDAFVVYGRSMKDLPPETALVEQARALGERLSKRQTAPALEQYNGPVLFEGQGAAELVARLFAEQLPAEPRLISDNPRLFQALQTQQESALANKIGARVLPTFLSVVDKPTATEAENHALYGGYKVDEEGTPAGETVVVEHGILKTLLTSRAPVRGVPRSTGNSRGRGVAPSNLFLDSDSTSSPEELKKQLLELAKSRGNEYGILIRRLSNRTAVMAYRVYPDGHEELLRNAMLSGVNTGSFKDILAVSNTRTVYTEPFTPRNNSPFNFNPFAAAPLFVSYVVPSLLFEDMTVEQPPGAVTKPPVIGHPFFAKASGK